MKALANLNLLLKVEVKDKNGKIVFSREKIANSFVLQFLQLLAIQMYPSAPLTLTSVDNVAEICTAHANALKNEAIAGNTFLGIAVGTGATPVDNLDYAMETKIGNGGGAGQLNYGASSKVNPAEVGANVDLVRTRTFVNSSGGTINVTEFGMISVGYSGTDEYFLIIHDVISAVPVNDGQTLTVTYTFRTTV